MIGSLPPVNRVAYSATPKASAPAQPEVAGDSVSLGQSAARLGKSAALNAMDVVKYGALFASTAAAGWLGGGPGILASMAGSAVGYGIYACTVNEGPSAFKAATAGALVGAFGGFTGAIAGPMGMVVMGALGAGCAVISKVCNWSEGWNRDGKYTG